MTVAGSRRSAPRTEIERMVPGVDGGAAGAGCAADGAGAAVSCAKRGADQPPRIVPTRSTAPVRRVIALLVETTRSRPLLNAPALDTRRGIDDRQALPQAR